MTWGGMTILGGREDPNRASASLDPSVLAELIRLAITLRNKGPSDVAPTSVLKTRQEFLQESLGGTEAKDAFERIIGGDELQPVAYLERGAIAARAVARVDLRGGGYGTGFLIAPHVLITNNHVLPDGGIAARAVANFHFEVDIADVEVGPVVYGFRPSDLFFTSPELDFSVVAVEPTSHDGVPLAQFGYLPLLETVGKVSEGEWLTAIQHPDGLRKQICVRENQFIKRDDNFLWYTTDTKPGSSGSPVFNNDWYVVALHHAGVPEKRDGVVQKRSDGTVNWIANEGARASRIFETLKQTHPQHPLLLPLYAATPASARITAPPKEISTIALSPKGGPMADTRTISVPLELSIQIGPDGRPGSVIANTRGAIESTGPAISFLEKRTKPTARFDAPFDEDYSARKGYNANFLGTGDKRVGLPHLSPALKAVAAPLIEPQANNKNVLHYHNYSVVMHAKRRLAIYSAANISFGDRFELSRPTDVWRRDPRILADHQLENWYYASNKFDRGHLTRREDLEYGKKPKDALISAADTCHWSNCTPQHERFNQNKEIWQGIERYVLEKSIIEGEVNTQIFTGPILDEGDPEYREIQYPLQFWKVVAALKADGKLFATAYIAGQEEVIAQFGIEVTEVPFGAYKTFQTKIAEIERLTGLTFVCGQDDAKKLRTFDPLETGAPARRRRPRPQESTGFAVPEGYYEITDLEDIQT